MPRPVYWLSDLPTHCQVSGKLLTDRFVDGKTPGGACGILHPETFAGFGYKPAQGVGQLYEKQADGSWLKIEG
jgi:hypothetical protein